MSAGGGERKDSIVPGPSATLGEISEFIRVAAGHMRELGLTSVDVELQGTRIRLRAGAKATRVFHEGAVPGNPLMVVDDRRDAASDDGVFITAPMIGTYYASAGPDEPVFVEPGDEIEVGQTIGIIEAMKIMNELAADRAGVVLEVLVRNAQAVEYGQPLLRIAPADGD